VPRRAPWCRVLLGRPRKRPADRAWDRGQCPHQDLLQTTCWWHGLRGSSLRTTRPPYRRTRQLSPLSRRARCVRDGAHSSPVWRPTAPQRSTRQGAGTAAHCPRSHRGDGPYGLDTSCRRRTCRHRGQAAHPPTTPDRAAHLPGDAGGPARGKGMCNKEIAAALFLSPKTVEHHLSNVYRKRGFRSEQRSPCRFVVSAPRGRLTRTAIRAPRPAGHPRPARSDFSDTRRGAGL
jgi:Bacterial regulatory proteins, luxR family